MYSTDEKKRGIMEKLFFIQFNVSKVAEYSYLLDDTDNDHPSISFYSSMCSVA